MRKLEDLRVAIIGAGPSGLTIGYYLKALGLKSVKFFEAQSEVGGQSVTKDVEGVPVELGTVYLTDGYILARKIAKSVGCPAKVLPEASVLNDQGKIFTPADPRFSLLLRYLYHWLRWYFGGQMRAPTRPDNALTFGDWLRRRGLGELARGFAFSAGCTAQLYGPIDDISAHSGLNWMRPSLFLSARLKDVGHIPQGFQNMWKKLWEALGFSIQFGAQIARVKPVRDGDGYRVELHFKETDGKETDGKEPYETFDHVFLACPLDYLEDHPVDHCAGNPWQRLEHPLTEAFRTRYSPFAATEVYSGAWTAKQASWPDAALSRCYLPAASTEERGPLLTVRNYDRDAERAVGQFCSYAFAEAPLEEGQDDQTRLERNRDQVVHDMKKFVGLEDIDILHDRLWRYNNRYSQQQLIEGLPMFIEASQGKKHVWYAGGTMSHWNIDAITDYSLLLVKRFAKRIDAPFFKRLKLRRMGSLFSDF